MATQQNAAQMSIARAAMMLMVSAGTLSGPNSPTFRNGHRIGRGKRGLHSVWAKIGRGRYRPHMGNAERARLGLSPVPVQRGEQLTGWRGMPKVTRQIIRAARRAGAKSVRRTQGGAHVR